MAYDIETKQIKGHRYAAVRAKTTLNKVAEIPAVSGGSNSKNPSRNPQDIAVHRQGVLAPSIGQHTFGHLLSNSVDLPEGVNITGHLPPLSQELRQGFYERYLPFPQDVMSSCREAGIQRAQNLRIWEMFEKRAAHFHQVSVLGTGAEAKQHQHAVGAPAVAVADPQLRFPPKTGIPAF